MYSFFVRIYGVSSSALISVRCLTPLDRQAWTQKISHYVKVNQKTKLELSKKYFWCMQVYYSGAPNDGFLPNDLKGLKRCFMLSGVLLKLCRLILGCAIKILHDLFGHSRETVIFPNLLGLYCPFPENLRSYCLSENST